MKVLFSVLARDEQNVTKKIKELQKLKIPYIIICGKELEIPHLFYRVPRGKYDAINYLGSLLPEETDIVIMNDVDTEIFSIEKALNRFISGKVDILFVRLEFKEGPQKLFYQILDIIRRRVLITASGELIFVRRRVLEKVLPLKACKAEDTYILFKALELGYKADFYEESYVITQRTKSPEKEEAYRRKTVCGIYQALSYTNPPISIKLFYALLPFATPLLLLTGKKGYFSMKGILLGLSDFLHGDKSGIWQQNYLK